MNAIRLRFLVAISIIISTACDNEDPAPNLLEVVNLGERIAFTENPGCAQFALTHISENKLVIGVRQPKLIDLDAKTVIGIPLSADKLLTNKAQVKVTETHLWNIYTEAPFSHRPPTLLHINRFDITTGREMLLVDKLFYSGFDYFPMLATNEIDLFYNKVTATDQNGFELTDDIVYRINIYNGIETNLPVKGTPTSFNKSGNLLLYVTDDGYHQYDLAAQQSTFLSERVNSVESSLFYIKDEPFVIYGASGSNQPVYIKSLFETNEIQIGDDGSANISSVKVSPDEQYICLWIIRRIEARDGGYTYAELRLYDFDTQKTELVFRGEQNISFDSEHEFCDWGYPDYNANFSPNGEKLTYIFNGNIYQFSLGN